MSASPLLAADASARVVAALLLAAAPAGGARASGQAAPAGRDTAAGAGWFAARADSLVRAAVEEGRVPGVALAVVRGGETTVSRGYGVAELAEGTPVSPRTTRFSVGSVSKLVTAVAALQLADAGRLSLSEPLRRHAPGRILPPGPGEAVTLHDLLTHTSGLEPASVGLVARAPPEPGGLRRYLSRVMPARTHPPGRLYLYSQHGYGVVGLAVSAASGEAFVRYADEHVFAPLGMDRSTFRQRALSRPETAAGYYLDGRDTIPAPTAYHRIPPAGGLVTTAEDLARLAGALVGSGRPGDRRVLSPRARRRLLERQWSPHPRETVEGTAYGLFEHRSCGVRALTTRGWVGGHSAYLHLVPAEEAAFVVLGNANSLGSLESPLRRALHRDLADGPCRAERAAGGAGRSASPSAAAADTPAAARAAGRESRAGAPGDAESGAASPVPRLPRLFGHYRAIGYAGRGLEALGRYFLAPQITVAPGPRGPVIDFGGTRVAAEPVAPGLLRASWREGQVAHFAFVDDDGGDVGYMMWGGIAHEKVPPYRTRAAVLVATLLLAAVFAGGLTAPAARLSAGLWRGGGGVPRRRALWLHAIAAAVSLAGLGFAAVMVIQLGAPERYRFAFGVPLPVRAALRIPYLMLLGGVALAAGTLSARRRGEGAPWERALWTAVASGGVFVGLVAWRAGLPLL